MTIKEIDQKVTPEMVSLWIGSDATKDDLMVLFAEFANGEYLATDFKADVLDTYRMIKESRKWEN